MFHVHKDHNTDITKDNILQCFPRLISAYTLHLRSLGDSFIYNKDDGLLNKTILFVRDMYSEEFGLLSDSLKEHENAQLEMSIDELVSLVESRKARSAASPNLSVDDIMTQINTNVIKLIEKNSTNEFNLESLNTFVKARGYLKKIFNKTARYENHIKLLQTHLENGTSPPSLFFKRFPRPMLIDDDEFVDWYNDSILKWQEIIMLKLIETLKSRIFDLFKEITKLKAILKDEEKLNDKLNNLNEIVLNELKHNFNIKNEQTLNCKIIKYKVIKSNRVNSQRIHNDDSRSDTSSFILGYSKGSREVKSQNNTRNGHVTQRINSNNTNNNHNNSQNNTNQTNNQRNHVNRTTYNNNNSNRNNNNINSSPNNNQMGSNNNNNSSNNQRGSNNNQRGSNNNQRGSNNSGFRGRRRKPARRK
jgi:hypothetical protein